MRRRLFGLDRAIVWPEAPFGEPVFFRGNDTIEPEDAAAGYR